MAIGMAIDGISPSCSLLTARLEGLAVGVCGICHRKYTTPITETIRDQSQTAKLLELIYFPFANNAIQNPINQAVMADRFGLQERGITIEILMPRSIGLG